MTIVLKAAEQAAGSRRDAAVVETVEGMLDEIRSRGTDAVREFSRELDDWSPQSFRVTEAEIEAAAGAIAPELAESIDFALAQVRRFARAQRDQMQDLRVETLPGVTLGHDLRPVRSVGAYVPGGRYPLLASAFMTVAVAREAGVERVAAMAPPQDGAGINPATLYAIAHSGASEIYCIGGVQALAMLAFGLAGAEPVEMLIGPGNAYVTEGKRQLFGEVGIDLLAGPSEILILAGPEATARTIAVDLLSQAEHGPTSRAVLVTWSQALGEEVLHEIEQALPSLPTGAVAGAAWAALGEVLFVSDRREAIAVADGIAAEHVHVQGSKDDQEFVHRHLSNYGSLFLGAETTVVFGDKAIGTNHCLPTDRAARFSGGLWVGTFLRALTFQEVTAQGAEPVARAAASISAAERMEAHVSSALLRGAQSSMHP